MRAFIIKHKGKTIWQNMYLTDKITIEDKSFYIGTIFFRKKDAQKYLSVLKYKEFYEVIGVTIDKSKQDNRKTKISE